MFDLDRFLADCCAAVAEDPSHRAVREVAARAVADPAAVAACLGEPQRGGVTPLYQSDALTVLHVVWAPLMNVPPHDHKMWAVISVYDGREDNIYWRRIADEGAPQIEAAGARSLSAGDVEPLGRDIIHSVVNPVDRLTSAIHLYGGDFLNTPRIEWEPETHEARPAAFERTRTYFDRANRLLDAGG